MQKYEKKGLRWLPYILLALGLGLLLLSKVAPAFVDRFYVRGVYRAVAQAVSYVVSWIPFSVAEVSLYGLVLWLLFQLGRGVVRSVRTPQAAGKLWKGYGRDLWRGAVYVLAVFLLHCGVNYYRVPLAQQLGYTLAPASAEELTTMAQAMLLETNQAATRVRRNPEGVFLPNHTFDGMKASVQQAYDSMAVALSGTFSGRFPATKPIMASHYMSYTQIMGFFFPWTLEANINKDVPVFWHPSLIAHEQAHVHGFMREEEANFIAFLVGRYTLDPDLTYSAWLHTYIYVLNAVSQVNPQAHAQLVAGLAPQVKHDLLQNNAYWDGFQSKLGEVSSKVNDAYLKANGQAEGVRSYGLVVDLLLADFKKNAASMQQTTTPSVYMGESK